MRRARPAAAAALLALLTSACSMPSLSAAPAGPAPIAARTAATTRAATTRAAGPLAVAQATHEYPSPPVHERASASASDPVRAVRVFADAYINWSAATVAGDMAALAAGSIGQARSAMQLASVQTGSDYELARAGIANHGSVEAIAPVAEHPTEYAVVTLERTTATDSTAYQGLAPAWHVALATVTELSPGRWVVSGWQPEN